MKLLGQYDAINPGESELFGMDFARSALRPGDTFVGIAWTLVNAIPTPQTDPTPQARVIGAQSLNGTISSQEIAGTLPFVIYVISATATMASGDIKTLWGFLLSFPPGALLPTPR